MDLFVGSASVIAGWQLVPVHRPDSTPIAGREQVLTLVLRGCRRDASKRYCEPVGDVCAFGRQGFLVYAATGFSGRIRSSSSAARKAVLFAIMGSIVWSLTMPVVFTTAAMSGAAMSGAIALLRSAAPSVDKRSRPSSPSR